jgi:hypothetical protein
MEFAKTPAAQRAKYAVGMTPPPPPTCGQRLDESSGISNSKIKCARDASADLF